MHSQFYKNPHQLKEGAVLVVGSGSSGSQIAQEIMLSGRKVFFGELTKKGVHVLLVYGDPGYYKRFGFNEDIGKLFVPQYTLKYPFGWLGIKLNNYTVTKSPIEFECIDALNKPELW